MLDKSKIMSFVATTDGKKARQFYEKTLGLHFVSGDQFALVFDANGTMLRVQRVEKVDPRAYTSIGWEVDDIAKVVRLLKKRGVRFARYEGMKQDTDGIWTAPSKAKIAWFNDPDGNILSLTEFGE